MDDWQRTAQEIEGLEHVPRGVIAYMRAGHASAYPPIFESASGVYATAAGGRRYLDWVMGKGPLTFGHAREEIDRAAFEAARRGQLRPGLSPDYGAVAAQLARLVPPMRSSAFAKNGSDAVAIALRLARVFTGRGWVLSSGYHGWDERVSPSGAVDATLPARDAGVADFGYDLERLAAVLAADGDRVAAVLVSPEPAFLGAPFLEEVASLARGAGALFCVDEVRCGFRVAPGGAHALFGVEPDLVCLSKGLTNGYPLAAVGGREDVMASSRDTFIFGTYYGEAASLAAARVCLALTEAERPHEAIAAVGARLSEAMDAAFAEHGVHAHVLGPPSMPTFLFAEPEDEARFFAGAVDAGVLFFQDDAQCPSAAHEVAHVDETRRALGPVLAGLGRPARPASASGETIDRYARRRGILRG